ncbi:MAG: hypothetical protein MJZ48_03905 [Paludibacteraceae bacterium]|nr:hypothetical protein [Paludibacteraceae bacterium]
MADFHDITPRPRRSTNGTYFIYPLDEMHGKMRGKHPSNDPTVTFVNRFHDYGHNRDQQGRKGHQSYYYHKHQGEWSDGATANRALMALTRANTHAQIKDEQQSATWKQEYENYCVAKKDVPHYTSLFTYVYSVLYQQYKEQLALDFASHQRTDLINQFEQAFLLQRSKELSSITDVHLTGTQIEQQAQQQAQEYINQRIK